MTKENVLEELRNIVINHPVFPGDTISHATADECGRRGRAMKNGNGDWILTAPGLKKYLELNDEHHRNRR